MGRQLLVTGLLAGLLGVTPAAGRAPTIAASAQLTILSLNLAMREDVDAIAAELSARHLLPGADVVLLQEVIERDGGPDVGSQLAARFGLSGVFGRAFALDSHRTMGLAILAREPPAAPRVVQLKRFDLSFRSRRRIALGASLATPAGAISVYNVHLDTRINMRDRVEQLAAVLRELESGGDTPVVLGGDFNTNDYRWLFHSIPLPVAWYQSDGLLRFMQRQGFSSAITTREPTHDAFGMHLDWIFLRGLNAGTSAVQPIAISDHHALVASIIRPEPAQSGPGR
jgi:endonuclease/exonuclease/phosphatase family metal-dependent hydrolase